MAAEVFGFYWHHNYMSDSGFNIGVAARAEIFFRGLIWLDDLDFYREFEEWIDYRIFGHREIVSMNGVLTRLFLAVLLLVAVTGCTKNESSASSTSTTVTFPEISTMHRLQTAGKINIGVKFDQPGFGQKNENGVLEGFDIEIAKLIAQGIFGGNIDVVAGRINFVESQPLNRQAQITDGAVDMVIATYGITNERKSMIDFAGPYYIAHGDVMVNQSNESINTLADLAGKNVCTTTNSSYVTALQVKSPEAKVITYDTYAKCVEALKSDSVAAVATDSTILAGLAQASRGSYRMVGAPFTDEPYGIGIKRGDEAFRSFINDRLDAMSRDDTWKQAFDKTLAKLGLATPPQPQVDRYAPALTTTVTPVPSAPVQ